LDVLLLRVRSHTSSGRLRRRGWVQGLSALISLLLVFSQTVAVLHFALVAHRFCPMHGLEHLGAAHGGAHLHAPASDSDRTTLAAAASSEEAPDPCLLASLHDRATPPSFAPAGRTAPPPSVRGPRPVCAELTRAPQALLLVAPKQGPPV
jgi:hypothetical protein